jgi:hypothetical protein
MRLDGELRPRNTATLRGLASMPVRVEARAAAEARA